jgi:3,4-dihydroxy 2-butanone 4-phosphate synthase
MHHLSIPEAIAEIRDGKFIIVVDDEGRENEGDLVMAAQCVTPEAVNFMTRYGRGLICVPTTGERLDALELPLMVPQSENSSGFGTAFTVSVEARSGVTTGISAYDRARTIQTLADPSSTSGDLSRPGHVFPLRAHPDGVLGRPGQTEASVDLVRLAGLNPVAVICEIIDEDGTMARMPLVERPEAVLAEADHDLIERLERKVTPPLLAIAGVGTFLVLWGWGVAAHRWVTAWQPMPYTRAEFMVDHGAPISERLRTWIQTTGDEVFPRVQEAFPSNVQFALWLALGVGLIVTAIAALIVQRQQVALERSWKRIHDKGKRWRDATISTLKADLQDTENRLARENIQAALEEVEARLERLRALESALESDLCSDPDIDPVIDERIAPSIQPAPELTPLEVAQIVSTFRRGRHDDAAFREDPLQVIEDLFQDAATVAGDPEPQLHREVRHLERSLIRAIPPSGSVRTPPVVEDLEDGSAYVRTASFLAVPMAIAPYLSSNDALCHGIPVEDRFYAMVVESGMNARHVLGHQVTRGGDQTVSAEERFVDIAGTASRGIRSAGRDQAPDTLSERQDATADAHDELGLAAIAVDRTTHETEE